MALVRKLQKEPCLLDIPLYRQRLSRLTESDGQDDISDHYSYKSSSYKESAYQSSYQSDGSNVPQSASKALENYIKDFERRPADTILAIDYGGGKLEHIQVPCPRPALPVSPERSYLPSVTELLSSDPRTAHSALSSPYTTPCHSPTKPASNATSPPNSMRGIFWETTTNQPRPKPMDVRLSPIKKVPSSNQDSKSEDARSESIPRASPRGYSTSPHKPSPFANLVDLSVKPLDGIDLDTECEAVLKKYQGVLPAHPCPSWIGDISMNTTTTAGSKKTSYQIPEWVKELEHADTSDILSIVEKRLDASKTSDEKPKARFPGAEEVETRIRVVEPEVVRSRSAEPEQRKRPRTRSEERFTSVPVPRTRGRRERSLSCTSVTASEVSHVSEQNQLDEMSGKMDADMSPESELNNLSPGSASSGRVGASTWGRPLEKLKNMLFTVQTLDSQQTKAPSFLDDVEIARLAEASAPLQRALEHLSNVRDIIKSSPTKLPSEQVTK